MNVDGLISAIFAKSALWDQKDPMHHNRHVLDKQWDEVAEQMQTTRDVVRNKWKSLRDTFRKELRKFPTPRSGDGAVPKWSSNWTYFESLSFLKDQFTTRPSSGNLKEPEIADCIQIDLDENSMATNEMAESPTLEETPSTSRQRGVKKRKRDEDDIGAALVRLEEDKMKILRKQEQRKDDDDVQFLHSLLPHIKTLPPAEKMLLRLKMQGLVYNFVYAEGRADGDCADQCNDLC